MMMSNKKQTLEFIFTRIQRIEEESRFYCLSDSGARNQMIEMYTKAIGQMGEIHFLANEVHDLLDPIRQEVTIGLRLLADLTQALDDANVLLRDTNRGCNCVDDLGMNHRFEILSEVRSKYFPEFHNRPIEIK